MALTGHLRADFSPFRRCLASLLRLCEPSDFLRPGSGIMNHKQEKYDGGFKLHIDGSTGGLVRSPSASAGLN